MTRYPRTPSIVRLVALLIAAALTAAACAEATQAELAERYGRAGRDDAQSTGTLPPPSTTVGSGDTADPAPDVEPFDGGEVAAGTSTDGRPPRDTPLSADGGDCPFDPGAYDVTCGVVEIPAEVDGIDPIEIAFARFHSTGSAPEPDPVVYLHGGPGGAILAEADLFARSIVDPFIDRRDVVLYDQRGAGQSSPLPECFEAWDLDDDFFGDDVPHLDLRRGYNDALADCGARLSADDDLDLSDYGSAVHADDLIDLIRALGFAEINLYGNSYGTRLAQTVMRDHPGPVRSVILSGVYPIEENLVGSTPAAFESAVRAIAEGCLSFSSCRADLPDPIGSLEARVAALDADPVVFDVPIDARATYPFVVAGDDLLNILHGLLYSSDGAALIPDLLVDLEAGDLDRLERVAPDGIYNTSDVGGYLGVQCREEVPFTTPEERERADTYATIWDRINLPPGLLSADLIEICDAWSGIGSAEPLENEPVTWDQPTLLLSGGFDPITPPEWATGMAERLPNAALAFSADRGHDADEGPCQHELMASFIDDPRADIDTSCTLEYDTPYLTATNIQLRRPNEIELEDSIFDIDPGPDTEWIDMRLPTWVADFYEDEEAYWRNLDIYDPTVIVVRSGPLDVDELIAYLPYETTRVEFGDSPTPDEVADGWVREVFDTVALDIVTYRTTSGPDMNVSVIGRPDDIEELEKTAVLPMIQSITFG